MYADWFGLALGMPLAPVVPEISEQFLLFCIHRDGRLALTQTPAHAAVDVAELGVAVGMVGGYLPFAILYLVPYLMGLTASELVESLAVLPLAVVPLAFAWAILRYKLWDLGLIVRDTISSTLTLLLGVVGFSLVHLGITRGLPQDLTLARNLLSFVAGLTIAGLLVPTRHGIASALERFQYRGSFGKRRAPVGQPRCRRLMPPAPFSWQLAPARSRSVRPRRQARAWWCAHHSNHR